MCITCGCGSAQTSINGRISPARRPAPGKVQSRVYRSLQPHEHEAQHEHGQLHEHTDAHEHSPWHVHGSQPVPGQAQETSRLVRIERDVLAKNDAWADLNRRLFAEKGVLALNFVSSPGSGKTALLVRTIKALGGLPVAVIEGDQQTAFDAERIRATGAPAVQINTGKGCHLDAQMVARALPELDLAGLAMLFIENVGNLVCPSAFDLGEAGKVAVLSVTEGEDKPLKYPDMFRAARLMLLNKCDLLPHLDFDVERALECARQVNPAIEVIRVSAKTGEGMDHWLAWLARQRASITEAAYA